MKNRFGLPRDIPTEVRRRVRRRCGFGCVICGSAIVTYEHFDPPFRDAKTHRPEGITLLCGTHQLESSKGLLSKESISLANAKPLCHQRGFAAQALDLGNTRPTLLLGGTDFSECGPGVAFNDRWLFRVRPPEPHSGRWRLSAVFYASDGTIASEIRDNELLIPAGPFEIEQVGRRLLVRGGDEVALDLEVLPPSKLALNRYVIPVPNGVIFIGKKLVTDPVSGEEETKSVLEFRHNMGGTQTFVNCMFRSDMGLNVSLAANGLTLGTKQLR
jgi:hypothetical protein